MGHHSTLIGGGKGEGCLFCSDAHTIVASVVNVLTRIVGVKSLKRQNLEPKNAQNGKQPLWKNASGDYRVIITSSAANQR